MSLDPWDEGVRYGRGVFETLKVHNGKALLENWHYESLEKACESLDIRSVGAEKFHLHSDMKDGIWRWFVTKELAWDLWHFSKGEVKESYSLSFSPLVVCSRSWEVRHKTMSYLLHIQAREKAYTDECVLVNENQEIASAAMGNLFWIKNGVIYTPDVQCGCREGVTRRWVLECSGENIEVGSWGIDALDDAEEIFITNSLIGMMPVTEWVTTRLKRTLENHEIVNRIREKYQEELLD